MREISYSQAIREAFVELLRTDSRVFILGQGVWSPWYVGTSMKDLDKEFGRGRIIDTPVSEAATTGAAVGAAIAGMRPVVIHPRMDFMLLAVEQIVSQAANWHFMFGGRVNAPVTIRAIINRGGEQGAQHSQSVHAWFMHVPGLKVVMPATPYDAKGLLVASILDGNPVLYVDDRWLYNEVGEVPEDLYSVPIGKAALRREGTDLTIVGSSYMALQAIIAAEALAENGISAEVIDLRTIKPLDDALIIQSVRKTGRLLVTDGGWTTCGVAAEVIARVTIQALESLRGPVARVCLPDVPAPMSAPLERAYYPGSERIIEAVERMLDSSEARS